MFISFEGLDGSGKTTQVQRLAQKLAADGLDVVLVREPGGTALGEAVRTWLLDPATEIAPRAELMLFAAARAQLVATVIRPALANGSFVVADRFTDSTTAYQGVARGLLTMAEAEAFHHLATGGLVPDLTLFVDVPVEVASARRAASRPDRIEQSGDAFFERVRIGYHEAAASHSHRIKRLDGMLSEAALAEAAWSQIQAVLGTG